VNNSKTKMIGREETNKIVRRKYDKKTKMEG